MKRDMDVVRSLLLRAEAAAGQVDVHDPVETYHVHIMINGGLLEGHIITEMGSDQPLESCIHNLTWAGHEFLDAARSDTLWHKAKDKVIKPGASWTFSLLGEWLKAEARKHIPDLGIPGAP